VRGTSVAIPVAQSTTSFVITSVIFFSFLL